MIIFGSVNILWITWGLLQDWTGLRGHFYAFYGLFLRSMYRMEICFGVSKLSNIFWSMPDIPNICLVNTRCWV